MAITNTDARGNTVITQGERVRLRDAFGKFKELLGQRGDVRIHPEMMKVLAHGWDILRMDSEAPLAFYQKTLLGQSNNIVNQGSQFVRHGDGSTIVTDKDRACLRAMYATMLSVLCRDHIEVPFAFQASLAEAWDIVRNMDDPPLPYEQKGRIVLPFGETLTPVVQASKGFR